MTENPDISQSPLLREDDTNLRDSLLVPYHPAWRSGSKFRIPAKFSRALALAIFVLSLAYCLITASLPGLAPLIFIPWTAWALWKGPTRDAANELLIDSDRIGILPSRPHAISIADIRIYEESVSHIDIYHEQISGLSKCRFLRHEFHAADWDRLGPILQARVRTASPDARIHTPLSPPDRRIFRRKD